MRFFYAVVLLIVVNSVLVYSQDRSADVWYFGNNAGISFASGAPVPLNDGRTTSGEGTSVMCDRTTGAVLFYTDGNKVWARDGSELRTGIGGNVGSATQAALIIPHPGNTSEYYIFTTEDESSGANSTARVTPVNVTGTTVTVGTTTTIESSACEKITAAKACNGVDYWVVFKRQNGEFRSYRITPTAGFSPIAVVTSAVGIAVSGINVRGEMKISPDGRFLACANENAGLEVCTFNNATGQVTALQQFDVGQLRYGISFSPDSRLFYAGTGWTPAPQKEIGQYDLSAPSISASRVVVGTVGAGFGAGMMANGPDGRIYMARATNSSSLGVIQNPNVRGVGCQYVDIGYTLQFGTCVFGLPNFAQNFFVPRLVAGDTIVCPGTTVQLGTPNQQGFTYSWSPAGAVSNPSLANPTFTANSPQSFTLTATDPLGCDIVQTINVGVFTVAPVQIAEVDPICPEQNAVLTATFVGAVTEPVWSPNIRLSSTIGASVTAAPLTTQRYTVSAQDANGCTMQGSVDVVVRTPPSVSLSPNGTLPLCDGESLTITPVTSATRLVWSTGAETPTLVVTQPGTYFVEALDVFGCIGRDTVEVVALARPSTQVTSDTTICLGASVALTATGALTFEWSPAIGLSTTSGPSVIATPPSTQTYRVIGENQAGCFDTSFVTVTVRTPIQPQLSVADTSFCTCDTLTVSVVGQFTNVVWSDGVVGTTRSITTSGNYFVTATDAFGCRSNSDTVFIDTLSSVANVDVSVDKQAGRDGERVNVTMAITNETELRRCLGAGPISVVFRMNSTVLAPVTTAGRGEITSDGIRIVTAQIGTGQGQPLTTSIPYTVTLGQDSITTITVLGASSSECTATIVGGSDTVNVLEICRAGGVPRFVLSPPTFTGLVRITPNPASTNISVLARFSDAGQHTINFVNTLGATVSSVSGEHSAQQTLEIPIDITTIPIGVYVVVLTAQNNRSSLLMQVSR